MSFMCPKCLLDVADPLASGMCPECGEPSGLCGVGRPPLIPPVPSIRASWRQECPELGTVLCKVSTTGIRHRPGSREVTLFRCIPAGCRLLCQPHADRVARGLSPWQPWQVSVTEAPAWLLPGKPGHVRA